MIVAWIYRLFVHSSTSFAIYPIIIIQKIEKIIEEYSYLDKKDGQKLSSEDMEKILDEPENTAIMAKAARQMAEDVFDVHKVNLKIRQTMGIGD